MATRTRTKLKQDGQNRTYISYFQSVMTIGIVNTARSIQEAEQKAREKFSREDLSCGIVGQTPFEISETEVWNPDFAGCIIPIDDKNGSMSFNLNDTTKQRIAAKMGVPPQEVTEDDYVEFVKSALERSL